MSMSPKEKYLTDNEYHALVDYLESMIHRCQFTPSELREAAILASINYEMGQLRPYPVSCSRNKELESALTVLDKFRKSKTWETTK